MNIKEKNSYRKKLINLQTFTFVLTKFGILKLKLFITYMYNICINVFLNGMMDRSLFLEFLF